MRNNIHEIRRIITVSLDELSRRTGIDPPKLSRIQNDLIEPREDETRKIAAALRLSIKKVFPESQLKEAEGTNDGDEFFELQKMAHKSESEWKQFLNHIFPTLNSIIQGNKKSITLSVKEARLLYELVHQFAEKRRLI